MTSSSGTEHRTDCAHTFDWHVIRRFVSVHRLDILAWFGVCSAVLAACTRSGLAELETAKPIYVQAAIGVLAAFAILLLVVTSHRLRAGILASWVVVGLCCGGVLYGPSDPTQRLFWSFLLPLWTTGIGMAARHPYRFLVAAFCLVSALLWLALGAKNFFSWFSGIHVLWLTALLALTLIHIEWKLGGRTREARRVGPSPSRMRDDFFQGIDALAPRPGLRGDELATHLDQDRWFLIADESGSGFVEAFESLGPTFRRVPPDRRDSPELSWWCLEDSNSSGRTVFLRLRDAREPGSPPSEESPNSMERWSDLAHLVNELDRRRLVAGLVLTCDARDFLSSGLDSESRQKGWVERSLTCLRTLHDQLKEDIPVSVAVTHVDAIPGCAELLNGTKASSTPMGPWGALLAESKAHNPEDASDGIESLTAAALAWAYEARAACVGESMASAELLRCMTFPDAFRAFLDTLLPALVELFVRQRNFQHPACFLRSLVFLPKAGGSAICRESLQHVLIADHLSDQIALRLSALEAAKR